MKGIETIIDLVIIEMKGTALDMKEGTIEEKETVRELKFNFINILVIKRRPV